MADRTGQRLGNYQLTRLIGRGGFAEVYLGEHVRLSTQAAIKILYTRLTESDEVEYFQREARTIAHLEHPHIVRVLDFDVQESIPFLIMGYAPHGNLRQGHPRGVPLPLKTIVNYMKQIAEALQYAHDDKVIHRDIKPENMLVGRHHEILLSDFGIALLAQTSRSQPTQQVAGTAHYMAPEQLQGKPRLASDQYALGIVAYEWLCGMRPFEGSFTEIASQHVLTPPPPLSEKIPPILLEVEQVVLTALEKDPHKRFGSVRAFATALEQACQTAPSYPVSLPTGTALTTLPSELPLLAEQAAEVLPSQSPLPTNIVTPPSFMLEPTNTVTPPNQSLQPTKEVTGEQSPQALPATILPTGPIAPLSSRQPKKEEMVSVTKESVPSRGSPPPPRHKASVWIFKIPLITLPITFVIGVIFAVINSNVGSVLTGTFTTISFTLSAVCLLWLVISSSVQSIHFKQNRKESVPSRGSPPPPRHKASVWIFKIPLITLLITFATTVISYSINRANNDNLSATLGVISFLLFIVCLLWLVISSLVYGISKFVKHVRK